MSHTRVILVAGSPSTGSRSTSVLRAIGRKLEDAGVSTRRYELHDFDAQELLSGDASKPNLQAFIQAAQAAHAIVVATPIYKATYAGALKVLLDVIPPEALVGKSALAVATGRLAAHLATVERAFNDLFRFFRVGQELTPLLLLDEQIATQGNEHRLNEAAEAALARSAQSLVDVLTSVGQRSDDS